MVSPVESALNDAIFYLVLFFTARLSRFSSWDSSMPWALWHNEMAYDQITKALF